MFWLELLGGMGGNPPPPHLISPPLVIQFLSSVGICLIPTPGQTPLNASHIAASRWCKLINKAGYFEKTLWIQIASGLNSHVAVATKTVLQLGMIHKIQFQNFLPASVKLAVIKQ